MFDLLGWLGFNKEGVVYKYQGMGDTKYPSVEVLFTVNGLNSPYTAFMIVDSGADISIIPKTIGESLGLKKTQLKYLGGIGGRIGYYVNHIHVVIANKKIAMPVAWISNDSSPLLLGRAGVFDKFKICFDERAGTVTFY